MRLIVAQIVQCRCYRSSATTPRSASCFHRYVMPPIRSALRATPHRVIDLVSCIKHAILAHMQTLMHAGGLLKPRCMHGDGQPLGQVCPQTWHSCSALPRPATKHIVLPPSPLSSWGGFRHGTAALATALLKLAFQLPRMSCSVSHTENVTATEP